MPENPNELNHKSQYDNKFLDYFLVCMVIIYGYFQSREIQTLG